MNFLSELKQKTARALETTESSACETVPLRNITNEYGEETYWDGRYAKEDVVYEWLVSWKLLQPMLVNRVPSEAKILHVGCGNSTLGVDIRKAGFGLGGCVNSDVSPAVIAQMEARFKEEEGVTFVVDDCTAMNMANASFDVVLDKGTLDALSCKSDKLAKEEATRKLVSEAYRVLTPGGTYIVISFSEQRKKPIELGAPWLSVSQERIHIPGKPDCYLYCATKVPMDT